jgi:hypothetical protein
VVTLANHTEILHIEAAVYQLAHSGIGFTVVIEDRDYDVIGSHAIVP